MAKRPDWDALAARASAKVAGLPSAARAEAGRHVSLAGEWVGGGPPGVVAKRPSTKPPGLTGVYDPDAPIVTKAERDEGKPGALRRSAKMHLNFTPSEEFVRRTVKRPATKPIRGGRSLSGGGR